MRTFFCAVFFVELLLLQGVILDESDPVITQLLPGAQQHDWDFKWYSGYFNIEGGKHLHYVFIESSDAPHIDPVVLWLNGGPGCSSMAGLFTEHGPLLENGTLRKNDYSWHKVSNMLYLESPSGTGYSYSDDGNFITNDDQASEDNYAAIKLFYKMFPRFKLNPLYLSGESYGGIFIPTLAMKIAEDKQFNLKGLLVGNGMTDYELNAYSSYYYAYYHGIIGKRSWDSLLESCCGKSQPSECHFVQTRTNYCRKQAIAANKKILTVNPYNIHHRCEGRTNDKDNISGRRITTPCFNPLQLVIYLNRRDVKTALHVTTPLVWRLCREKLAFGYRHTYKSMKEQYLFLIKKKKLRFMLYNGDEDAVCNFLGTEWFVDSLNLNVEERSRPWHFTAIDGELQVGGFAKSFSNFTFTTVKGAGHMVPTDKPEAAFKIFTSFLDDARL